ncbi:MAG: response regulator [Oscillospiraceae bacterium]|nr:response regulator [Oscillospiraceae bacterium]
MGNEQKIIVLVDDQALNLTIGKNLLKDLYKVYTIPSAELMFSLLENVKPDLILLDVMMPDMSGYEAIKILKSNPEWSRIPVIFLTACSDEESELKGLSLGAIDYILKPFSAPLLRKRIENQLLADEHKKNLQIFNDNLSEMIRQKTDNVIFFQNAMLDLMADMAEFPDELFSGHAARVQRIMEILLDAIIAEGAYKDEIAGWDRYSCAKAAQFHDIGKIVVSDAILHKKGTLEEEEFTLVKNHVNAGLQMLVRLEGLADESPILNHAEQIVGGHHERWDGSGYPAGLKGLDIPLEGRLMAIADVYDALISERPYREAYCLEDARSVIERGSGTAFDPELVRLFGKCIERIEAVAKEDGSCIYPH